jgi:hypothetical protein
MTIERNSSEQNAKGGPYLPDQVYRATNVTDRECWRVAHHDRPLPEDWPTRDAAEAHLNNLRRTGS